MCANKASTGRLLLVHTPRRSRVGSELSVTFRFEFVENAIIDILPHITRARAYDIALHAHTNRQATILLTWEENAREVALGKLN